MDGLDFDPEEQLHESLQFDDLIGSPWRFSNSFAEMKKEHGEEGFFLPSFSEGSVGRMSASR